MASGGLGVGTIKRPVDDHAWTKQYEVLHAERSSTATGSNQPGLTTDSSTTVTQQTQPHAHDDPVPTVSPMTPTCQTDDSATADDKQDTITHRTYRRG